MKSWQLTDLFIIRPGYHTIMDTKTRLYKDMIKLSSQTSGAISSWFNKDRAICYALTKNFVERAACLLQIANCKLQMQLQSSLLHWPEGPLQSGCVAWDVHALATALALQMSIAHRISHITNVVVVVNNQSANSKNFLLLFDCMLTTTTFVPWDILWGMQMS